MKSPTLFVLLAMLQFYSCTDDDPEPESAQGPIIENPVSVFAIKSGATFEWRLDDLPDSYTTEAEVVDIDAFSATPTLVSNLKAQGKKVIAYISVGSVENFRDDADQFPQEVIGAVYEGFEDENWLDIRNIDAIAPVLQARLDMIKDKGFDGVEPDNINGYQNTTGFPLTQEDAIIFSRWLIQEAHNRGLSIGQKNAEELVPDLVNEFDWMLTEGAFANNWYEQAIPYITVGKAVFFTEYTDTMTEAQFLANVCPIASTNNFSAVLKDRDLTNTTVYCD
ncbi:MAG: endo alpha-1,4 polygalactosaminidase [Saonia sp.]